MIVFVSRANGAINGAFASPQPGVAEEPVDDTSPEVVAFLAPPSAEQQAEARRGQAKQFVTSPEPLPLAVRAACLALMASLQECRAKVNEVLAAARTGDLSAVQPLQTGDTPEQAFDRVLALIDAGGT